MIGRRLFLGGIFAAGAAPAIVKAESLMKIIVPRQELYTGELGAIDGFRLVATNPAEQRLVDMMTRDMLRCAAPLLVLPQFSPLIPMPPPHFSSIRFVRPGGVIFAEYRKTT